MDVNSCRVCLTSDLNKLTSLFALESERSYAELIAFSCGIEIDPTDSILPQMICSNCIHLIRLACDIKQRCIDTELLLKQILKSELERKQDDSDCSKLTNNSETDINRIDFLNSGQSQVFSLKQFLKEDDVDSSNESFEIQQVSYKNRKKVKFVSLRKQNNRITKNANKKPETHDYRCFICEKVFDLISSKDLHVKQDHADVKVCRICNKRKQTAISLETHLRYHCFGYRFLCSSCGKSFRFKNLLENHFKVEHYNTVKFTCDMCKYDTKFKINLERHVKSVHMKLKNFKCDKCADHEYSTQVGLNLHLYRVHGVEAPVTCSDCLQGFTFESELRVHKKHCTKSKVRTRKARPQDAPVDILENGFRCRVCLQVYKTRSKWSVHFHHKHKNSNVCTVCNKQMASSTSLFKHIQVQHNNIKKFQCDICFRTFGFKHSLESHKNTHTGDKPFLCNFCSFKSGDRSTISKHKKKMHRQEAAR